MKANSFKDIEPTTIANGKRRSDAEINAAKRHALRLIRSGEIRTVNELAAAFGIRSVGGGLYNTAAGCKLVTELKKQKRLTKEAPRKKRTYTRKKHSLFWHIKRWWRGL